MIRKFIDEKVVSGLWRQTSLLMDGQTTLVVKLLLQLKNVYVECFSLCAASAISFMKLPISVFVLTILRNV